MCIGIPGELRDEDVAVGLVREYFADDPATGRARYSGAYFERLGGGGDRPEVAYQITAEDLLAVSMLSVPVVRYYALHVLDYRGREISGLLAQIPVDVALADDEAEHLIAQGGPAWKLWELLRDIKAAASGQEAPWSGRGRQAAGAQAPGPAPGLRQPPEEGAQEAPERPDVVA